ncbi:MAG TPA: hypothetical protein PLQ32_08435 [Flavihumibacter sp.]|mgnify:CR=1 FL=1|nr:hypothetical protein [Bacteroidota bacterium]HOA38805.1 hypothetical protein [Flavihumibacter sp.]HPZ88116.1 hypothetical protein [Flavihumibacter sp.]
MAHDHVQDWDNPQEKDFNYNWVNSSSFLFYLQVFLFLAFFVGCSYGLYTHRYKGHPKVNVPANTTFSPTYK